MSSALLDAIDVVSETLERLTRKKEKLLKRHARVLFIIIYKTFFKGHRLLKCLEFDGYDEDNPGKYRIVSDDGRVIISKNGTKVSGVSSEAYAKKQPLLDAIGEYGDVFGEYFYLTTIPGCDIMDEYVVYQATATLCLQSRLPEFVKLQLKSSV